MNLIVADPRERERPWLHYIRKLEIAEAAGLVRGRASKRLLEIGGGDGFVGHEMSEFGFEVTSIDLAPRTPQSYPVQYGDATNLPFPDGTFDVVMTCHVLEEIPWPKVFSEMRRVLKPDGVGVHIVATSQWSLLTNFWHFLILPVFLLKSVWRRLTGKASSSKAERNSATASGTLGPGGDPTKQTWTTEQRFQWMFLHPVGFYPSFVHEIVLFTGGAWKRLFERNHFEVVSSVPGPILASGFRVFPFKAIAARRSLSGIFPSSRIFMVRLDSGSSRPDIS